MLIHEKDCELDVSSLLLLFFNHVSNNLPHLLLLKNKIIVFKLCNDANYGKKNVTTTELLAVNYEG